MSENGEPPKSGWEGLFAPLGDEPELRPASAASFEPVVPAESDEPAAAPAPESAAESATEPATEPAAEPVPGSLAEPAAADEPEAAPAAEEPLPAPIPAPRAVGAFDPAALYSALQEDLAAEAPTAPAAPAAESPAAVPADAATGLTRRELREQREAAAAAGEPSTAAEPEVEQPVAAEPSVEQPAPVQDAFDAAASRLPEPLVEPVPWDPAPELPSEPAAHEPATESAVPVAERVAGTSEPAVMPTVPVQYDEVAAAQPPSVPPTRGAFPMQLDPPPPPGRRKRRLGWLGWFIPVVLVVALVGYPLIYAYANRDNPGWNVYGFSLSKSVETKVRQVLGIPMPSDYAGSGNGVAVVVTIKQGDTGADIAKALNQAGVTMTFDAFYELANQLSHSKDCANPDANNGCWPIIQFGNYNLQQQMSAKAALAALQDPANKIKNNLVIPEGSTLPQVLNLISATTGVPIDQVKAAAADPSKYGAANPANSLEGYLFPDTYQLDGTETPATILQRLVKETFSKLDALGVNPADRHAFLTGASIVQKESGPVPGDAAKVARVFQNRLAQNMKLQSDATVAYGAGNTTSIWNTSAQLGDAGNPYNTYVRAGLPIGPIAAPGQVALDAWVHPAAGDWLFFVPVNLKTGETHFSTTAAEHQQYVQQLLQWCQASAENAAYCK